MTDYPPDLGRAGNGPYRLLRGFGDSLVQRFLSALADPHAAQQARLSVILSAARGSRFAREHNLERIKTLNDLRAALPVRTHAEHAPWLNALADGELSALTGEAPTMLLETSGTTGHPKWLPVTPTWARSVAEAQQLWVMAMVRDHEAVSKGKALTIVSSAQHATAPGGLPVGSNTGRMHKAQPWWLRLRYPVPYRAFTIPHADLRLYTILRFALQQPISSLTTANPSTILLLCRRLEAWREALAGDLQDGTLRRGPATHIDCNHRRWFERRLRKRRPPTDWRPGHLWPLELINCWKGGPARYFVDRLPAALGRLIPVREVGVTASEGYFAIPLGDDWPGGVLWTAGHILEFIPEGDDRPLWSWELEVGQRYRMIITTEAGLYRYDLRDIVEVVGFCEASPVIRFVSKAGHYLNATGEKVSAEQVSAAMLAAAREMNFRPVGFTARVHLAEIPTFQVAVEGAPPPAFASALDAALRRLNVEYDGKRGSGRLGPLTVHPVPEGTYARYRAARVAAGAPEGQVKDPVVAQGGPAWQQVMDAAEV